MNRPTIRALFYLAALYDAVLGAAFLAAPGAVYDAFDVTPPNHWGYIQFPAALLIVFALMYLRVARDPGANRNLIPYGIMLKVAYCAVVFGYWFTTDLPAMWKPFAVFDLAFMILFVWAYAGIAPPAREARPA
jgi:hypothetical protein